VVHVALLLLLPLRLLLLLSPLSPSALKFETNIIHDNGASLSLCSKALADAIGLTGEGRPLGLSVFGNPNLVQQAFKATILVANAEGTNVGKAIVHVVPEFVDLKAIDWSKQAKDFSHLRTINFPTPFRNRECHILLGNDNHHLCQAKKGNITADNNPQAYPYATLTPLGWCAAGPTLPPAAGDHLFNILVKNASTEQKNKYKTHLSNIQTSLNLQD
jgi:hypothetical protein